MAAQNGYARCVTHLLQKGANMLQRDSEDRNCLTIAIQNHHKFVRHFLHAYNIYGYKVTKWSFKKQLANLKVL